MKIYALKKTRNGARTSEEVNQFAGKSLKDKNMLREVREYLRDYLGRNSDAKDVSKALCNFDGTLSYDVYTYELTELPS